MENKPNSKEMDDKFVAEIPRSALTGGIVCPHCMKHITPIYFIMAHKAEPRVDAHELTTEEGAGHGRPNNNTARDVV